MGQTDMLSTTDTTRAVQRPADPSNDVVSFAEIAHALLKHVRLILIAPLVFTTLSVVLFVLLGRSHVAESAFALINAAPNLSRLSGIAAQFGIAGPSARDADPIDLYVTLLRSRDVLRDIATAEFNYREDEEATNSSRVRLLDIYRVRGGTEEERLNRAMRLLRKQIKVRTNVASGVVTLKTKASTPVLAEAINRRMLDLVNNYNIGRKMLQAAVEREFVERQLQDARNSLLAAEQSLEHFLAENRSYANSPQLAFEAGRLQRRVDLHQQVYLSLAQSFEQVRLDEVRNTPVISIVDPPEGSALPSPRLIFVLIASAGFSLGAAVVGAVVIEAIRRERTNNPDAFKEIDAAWRSLLPKRRHRA